MSAAMSGDGKRMYAATSTQAGASAEGIFYSVDSGYNWLVCPNTAGIDWNQIAASNDGQTVVGVDIGEKIYASHDGCRTWELVGEKYGGSIALTPDGKTIFATNTNLNPFLDGVAKVR